MVCCSERSSNRDQKIIDIVISQIGWGWDYRQYHQLNLNQVAAMPLHSAYPWLAFLALRSFNKKVGYTFLIYPVLVWISVVYLGEHYVIDVIAGIIYASIATLSFIIKDKFKFG